MPLSLPIQLTRLALGIRATAKPNKSHAVEVAIPFTHPSFCSRSDILKSVSLGSMQTFALLPPTGNQSFTNGSNADLLPFSN
jgi:hypothetical protein